jgi:Do/DeqQ family serine protease
MRRSAPLWVGMSLGVVGLALGAYIARLPQAAKGAPEAAVERAAESQAVAAVAPPSEETISRAEALSDAFAGAASVASPSVVYIQGTQVIPGRRTTGDPFFDEFFGDSPFGRRFQYRTPEQQRQFEGSGVILAADGLVVTNDHIAREANKLQVTLTDSRTFEAEVLGRDPATDLALLRIRATGLPAIRIGDSKGLRVGQWVVAIGNPFGLTNTVTAGIVSARGRADVGVSMYEDFIQTDAAINPGNSGGALVNIRGELVGINTAIFSQSGGSVGIGFAVPSEIVQGVTQALERDGKVSRGWLGLIPQEVTPRIAERLGVEPGVGVVVVNLYQDSPADKFGLQVGDIITAINGQAVNTSSAARRLLLASPAGKPVTLTVSRRGQERTADIEPIQQPIDRETGLPLAGM